MICTVENEGTYESDITVHWKLTKTEDGAVLDTGSDTFAIDGGGDSIYSIFPSTTFLGDVRIYFWDDSATASAYLVFHTSGVSGGGSSGGGGVSGGATTPDDIIPQIPIPESEMGSQVLMLLLAISIISASIIVSIAINKSNSKKSYNK
jgi:hypothetical protein